MEITVSKESWEQLRQLLKIEHEHEDGMNECHICDEPLIDAAIKEIKRLRELQPVLRYKCSICGAGNHTSDNCRYNLYNKANIP